jgi:hypothetical protein
VDFAVTNWNLILRREKSQRSADDTPGCGWDAPAEGWFLAFTALANYVF